jgi:hypothetical protein
MGYSTPMTSAQLERAAYLTRRQFFARSSLGVGGVALASLLQADGATPRHGGLEGVPHFAPKAKRVIYLLQNGGPPHVDMFDFKPELEK